MSDEHLLFDFQSARDTTIIGSGTLLLTTKDEAFTEFAGYITFKYTHGLDSFLEMSGIRDISLKRVIMNTTLQIDASTIGCLAISISFNKSFPVSYYSLLEPLDGGVIRIRDQAKWKKTFDVGA